MEIWKRCDDANIYEASNEGRIRNRRTGKIMKTHINRQGYESLQIRIDGKPVVKRVHRLVAEAFHGGKHPGLDVNHIDGNKRNNRPENLEFCTRQENTRHSYDIGLSWSHKKKKIRIVETGEEFDSMTECGERLGVDRSSVGRCIHGRSKTCGGYHLEEI